MKGRYPRGRLAALVCALWVLPPVAAAAAPPAAPEKTPAVQLPQPLTRDAIRELVARLSEGEVRELLLAQLDKADDHDAALGGMASAGLVGLFVGAVLLELGYQIFMSWVYHDPAEPESQPAG